MSTLRGRRLRPGLPSGGALEEASATAGAVPCLERNPDSHAVYPRGPRTAAACAEGGKSFAAWPLRFFPTGRGRLDATPPRGRAGVQPLEYYLYLASTVPAGDLARAGARRLAQRVGWLARPLRPPREGDLLEVFCASDPGDLAFKLAAPRASLLWADSSRRAGLAAAAGRVEGAAERALERAERASRRVFEIFGRRVRFPRGHRGIDWQVDVLGQGRFAQDRDARDPELFPPGLDPKAPWALGRFEHAIALAQGVWLSPSQEDRARYAHEFARQLRHFAQLNPPGLGVHWSCTMEVALRAANISLAFLMLRHRPELQDGAFALDLAAALVSHGRFVCAHLEHTGAVPNNHFVANLVGLLHLGVIFPELGEARAWRALAAEGLRREMQRQVLEDGFSFEGSTSYHRLATELFTLALFAAHAGRIDLGDAFRARLHRMFRAARTYLAPGGAAPQLGDNDSGRALPLCSRAPLDHGYLLPLGAALFQDPELKPEGSTYCDEALWLMGPAGLDRWERLPESGPVRSGSLPKAGLFFLRGPGAYCAVSCGPNGQAGVGGHSHNDKLSVEIYAGEVPLIVDCGTYCYSSDPALRNRFRSTEAHSTVQVDGREQSRLPSGRLFALPDQSRARALAFSSGPARERFAGEHSGFARRKPAAVHRREVLFERAARLFLIRDEVAGEGIHSAVARFHLRDELARLRPSVEGERARLAQVGFPCAAAEPAVEIGPADHPLAALFCAGGELRLSASSYSPGYGERQPCLCVEVLKVGEVPLTFDVAVVLLGEPGRDPRSNDPSMPKR